MSTNPLEKALRVAENIELYPAHEIEDAIQYLARYIRSMENASKDFLVEAIAKQTVDGHNQPPIQLPHVPIRCKE